MAILHVCALLSMFKGFIVVNSPLWAALSDWELNSDFDNEHTGNIQAAFQTLSFDGLIYKGGEAQRLLYFITRQAAREPERLLNHVKRVYLAMACNERERLIGALVDLCWVSRGKGEMLIRRLVGQAAPMLPPETVLQLTSAMNVSDRSQLLELPLEHTVVVRSIVPTAC